MRHTATLTQPGITSAIYAEVEFEAEENTEPGQLILIAADLLLQNFEITGSWEGKPAQNKKDAT